MWDNCDFFFCFKNVAGSRSCSGRFRIFGSFRTDDSDPQRDPDQEQAKDSRRRDGGGQGRVPSLEDVPRLPQDSGHDPNLPMLQRPPHLQDLPPRTYRKQCQPDLSPMPGPSRQLPLPLCRENIAGRNRLLQ